MALKKPSEGKIPFNVAEAGKPCYTWYKIVGDLEAPDSIPLITLHGGPAACHELLTPLADMNKYWNIPVIFYDQIGNGRSTHLREKAGDEQFWTESLFVKELQNLVDFFGLQERAFDVYGQSWGGMLASRYATLHPKGMRKIVLADLPASVPLVLEGEKKLRAALPKEILEVIERCERDGTTDSKEYQEAVKVFSHRHICRLDPWPKELEIAYKHLQDDPTVNKTMWGGDKLKPTGNLKDWTIIPDAHKIEAETFILHGRYDHVQDVAVLPLFERITKVRWVTLEKSSHTGFFEERERYMELLAGFFGAKVKEQP